MNQNQKIVISKLNDFIKKYHTNILLRGIIFFVGFGLLYFLFTSLIEYFLWMGSSVRIFLFYTFLCVEAFLLYRFILLPLLKLWKLSKGLTFVEASNIIGNHFPSVNDKLLNFLQLSSSSDSSELLLASIEQKAIGLKIVPFSNAVNFKKNVKFLPILILPILLFSYLYISGNYGAVSQGFSRIVRFDEQFFRPAPFELQIVNETLEVEQGKDFLLVVKAVGDIIPEKAILFVGAEEYIMQSEKSGVFTYKFDKAIEDISFFVKANKVQTRNFILDIVKVPTISNFQMFLTFPKYLKRKSEVINGTGNANVPEGTVVSWNITANATSGVTFNSDDVLFKFNSSDKRFVFTKKVNDNIDYEIVTSNEQIQNYEKLYYKITTLRDSYPSIEVNAVNDSLRADTQYVVGQLSDDYGLSKLQIVYYPNGSSSMSKSQIPIASGTSDQFSFGFPGNLPVTKGISYDYYFEVFDNDAIHSFKSARSAVFSEKILSDDQEQDKLMQQQNENISGLAKSLKRQDMQMTALEKLKKSSKEKDILDFNDQQKVNDFIKKQQKQDEQMKDFANRMKENIEKNNDVPNKELKEELEKRLQNQLADLEKNKKLLEELKELSNKLKQDDITEKLERFKQKSQNQTKNLEQLVELTKRFYIEQKASQIIDKLDKLANKQEIITEKTTDNSKENQDKIKQEFNEVQKQLKELEKENNSLKAPLDIPKNEELEKRVEDDLNNASEELKKNTKEGVDKAKPKQKSAAKKMKEMAASMKEEMDMDSAEKEEEDAAMLRQILDNLLSFSFSEEQTMSQFKNLKRSSPSYNKNLKQQQDLRLQFQHVDDSLFALGLRNPKISEMINSEVGNVHYNINKAIENLVEANISKGVYHQQYTVSSANKLADMLSESLNNMQMSMKSSGKGKGKPKKGKGNGFQLSDIIKKQGELGDKAKQGQKSGEGKDGKDGKQGKAGSNGQDGNKDGEGEGNAGEILKIYQEQKQLRDALQNELNNKGLNPAGQNAINAMKDIEKQLLNKGFKNEVLQKMLNLKQELLKLDKALQVQGEEQKREADVAKKQFSNSTNALPAGVKDFMNSIEILNRQALPLQKSYNKKVQDYFKK